MSRTRVALEHHQRAVVAAKRKTTTTVRKEGVLLASKSSSSFPRTKPRDFRLASTTRGRRRGGEEEEYNGLLVLTFDLDDTIWPTAPVVTAANETYIQWLQTRVENFPETNVMNELMKGIREEREEMFRKRGEEHVVRFIINARSTVRAY